MRAWITSVVLLLAGLFASFAFMSTVVTTSAGCDPVDGGPSSDGSSDAEAGTSTTPDAGLVWGCSDNGTQCNCYSPASAEYTQTSCIAYSCCVATLDLTIHGCQCTNESPCTSSDPSAVRVQSCP